MSPRFPPTLDVSCPTCGAQIGAPCVDVDGKTHVARANLIGMDFKPHGHASNVCPKPKDPT